jgi:pimeloyl-ACP methyl ester carboxylesterase
VIRLVTPGGSFAALADGPEGGTPGLCLHGFPDTPLGYRPLLARLAAAGYRAIAPYMRGYRPSTLAGPYHTDRLGDDVIALADAVGGGRPVHLVGHDWGAVASYVAMARSPGRFARAVTMAVPHLNAFAANLRRHPAQLRRSWYMLFFQLGAQADRRVAAGDFELIERLWASWSPGFKPEAAYLAELKACLAESMPAPLEYYRAMFRPLREAMQRGRQRLKIGVPTLHLQGAQDGCISAEMGDGQARYFTAGFEARVVPGVGHFLHIERPDDVGGMIVEWLGRGATGS